MKQKTQKRLRHMLWLLKHGAIFYGGKGDYFFPKWLNWNTPMPIEE